MPVRFVLIKLKDGVTVTGVNSTQNVGGNAALDTVLTLSTGGTVQLLDFTEWNNSLLIA